MITTFLWIPRNVLKACPDQRGHDPDDEYACFPASCCSVAAKGDQREVVYQLLAAKATDTEHSACISGFTMRTLRSQWHKEWAKPEAPPPAPAPYQILLFGDVKASAMEHELQDFMTEAAGQGVDFVDQIKPARQIVSDMVDEAFEIFEEIYGEEDE